MGRGTDFCRIARNGRRLQGKQMGLASARRMWGRQVIWEVIEIVAEGPRTGLVEVEGQVESNGIQLVRKALVVFLRCFIHLRVTRILDIPNSQKILKLLQFKWFVSLFLFFFPIR